MSPWRLGESEPESVRTRRFRNVLAIVFLSVGVLSLYFSPMPWPLALAYLCLGVLAGLLMRTGIVGGILGLIVLFIVAKSDNLLHSIAPISPDVWWQPGILALTGAAIEYLTFKLVHRFAGLSRAKQSQSL